MRLQPKRLLLVGLFISKKNKNFIARTAADQLAELFEKHGFETIKVSTCVNQIVRFIDTVFIIITSFFKYNIAIVPLYGTPRSFLWSDISTLLLKLLGKKIILILHGGSIPERMKENPAKFLRVMKRSKVVVCPSAYFMRVTEKYGVKGILIENVLNTVEYEFNKKEKFRPRIFWMRTFEDIYNPEMAVRVAAKLAKRYPDFIMVMGGHDRGALAATKQLINELDLTHRIDLPGYLNNQQKNDYARACDIYICTNRIDNAPVSVIEMMTLGLPVVSVNTGGLPYLIKNNENGLLVDLDNDDAMANAIASIVESPALGKQLVRNARQFAAQFAEKPILSKWEQVFEKLNEEEPAFAFQRPRQLLSRILS